MDNDDHPNHPAHGRRIHYVLCALLVIELAAAAMIFAGITPHEQLAAASGQTQERTPPVPGPPTRQP